ncbi:MAG: hypothetical protein R8G66_15800 [Cytophagales bacterium]|nr:hypothetical protein [Cytophagales bacterium]
MSYPGKEEVKHLNQLTEALFKAISFDAGSEPNISGIKGLFIDNGLLINCNEDTPKALPVDQFIEHFHELFEQQHITSLHEVEVHHKTKIYDHIAHRYSFYEARTTPDGEPFAVGINTLQFVKIGSEWKITSMAWNDDNRGDGFFERTMACILK